MFERLLTPDERPLRLAPVQQASFQLDFEEERPLASQDGIAWQRELRERGYRLPKLTSVRQRTVNLQMGGLGAVSEQAVVAERSGWQVFMEDKASNFALFSTAINVERINYPGFPAFRREILDVYAVAKKMIAPKVRSRVHLSYVNALSDKDATSSTFWCGKVRSHFLGPISDENLNSDFSRGLSMFSFEKDDYAVELRIGLQSDQVYKGCIAFVFQTEVARKGVCAIDDIDVEQSLDSLHGTALKMFHAVLEPAYIVQLREGAE